MQRVNWSRELSFSSLRRTPRRSAASVSAALLISTVAVIGAPATPASAAADLTLSKSGPSSALVGEQVSYSLNAANPGNAPVYNVSFRDVLSAGLTYVAGSSSAIAGEPQVITSGTGCAARQTLIWSNIADLQANSTLALGFKAAPDADCLPVGAPITNSADAYGQTNSRLVPRFNADGTPISSSYTNSASSSPVTTTFTAVKVVKSEPSPEGELLRGVHDQTTTYTLTVTNNEANITSDVTLVDYLPASLEYLACGGDDNSAGSTVEYPGAPRLTATPPPAGFGICPPVGGSTEPRVTGVETVTLAAGNPQGYPAGVYTKVSYYLGDLDPGQSLPIKYRAAIPLRENAMFASAPPVGSGNQAANLDNNTGASTREGIPERSAVNRVLVSGVYEGPIQTAPGVIDPDGGPVTSATSLSRTIEDIAMRKTVSPGSFTQGGIATYTLTVRSSEYVTGSGIVITDTVPNGLCPLVPVGTPNAPVDCLSSGASQNPTGATITGVVFNDDGTVSATFSPLSISRNGTTTITYKARMRSLYGGTAGATGGLAGEPVSAGDSFTNNASLTANTTPISGTGESGTVAVGDTSSAKIGTSGPSMNKTVKPDSTAIDLAYECDGPSSGYGNSADLAATPGFDTSTLLWRKGSRICFRIKITFPTDVQTRNPVLTDFLPEGTTYEPGSAKLVGSPNGSNTVPTGQVVFNEADVVAGTANPTWVLGAPTQTGGPKSVARGSVFEVQLAVIVDGTTSGTSVDIEGNLAKMRSENSSGQAISLRDIEKVVLGPSPQIPTIKGVASVNGVSVPAVPAIPPSTPALGSGADFGSNRDGISVRQDDQVTFRIDLRNSGSKATKDNVATHQLTVWDLLPTQLTCADLVPGSYSYSPAVSADVTVDCYDSGDVGRPAGAPGGRSVIVWTDASDPASGSASSHKNTLYTADQISSGAAPTGATDRRSYLYTMKIPSQAAAAMVYDNTAGVRDFTTLTNRLTTEQFFPKSNIDPSVADTAESPAVSKDSSSVIVPAVTTTKGVTSAISEPGNIGGETSPAATTQGVPGELVTFTATARIPAKTTVYNATFADPLPTGLVIATPAPIADFAPDASAPVFGALPGSMSLGVVGNTATVTLPTTYVNSTTTDQLIRLRITARVLASEATNTHGTVRTNTATARWTLTADPSSTAVTRPASATVAVVEPNPAITKSSNAVSNTVTGGQTVTYSLRVSNASGRPPLHDSFVVDCLPAGMAFTSYGTIPAGSTSFAAVPGTGSNGCAAGETRLSWSVGSSNPSGTTVTGSLYGNTSVTLTYNATVATGAVSGVTYRNTAKVVGNSLDSGNRTDPLGTGDPNGRAYSKSTNYTLTVAGPTIAKSVEQPTYRVGDRARWTATVTIPKDVTLYDGVIIDRLPAGVDAGTLVTESTTCRVGSAAGAVCASPTTPLTALSNAVQGDSSTKVGWLLGDLTPLSSQRIVTVTYTAVVAVVPSNVAGKALTNSAIVGWNTVNGPDPTSAGVTPGKSSTPATATTVVIEPALMITKSVSDRFPEPGETFTYTVTIRNSSGPTVGPAYNVAVSDVVPDKVVVDSATVSNGGSLSGASGTGGGQIAWTLAGPIAPGGVVTLTYSAKFAASSTLNSDPRTNTASITSYTSLPTGGRTYVGGSAAAIVTPVFPNLTAVKSTPNGSSASIGTSFTWKFVITNTGAGRAVGVDFADVLPPNWRYDSGSARVKIAGGAAVALEPTASLAGAVQTLRWTNAGDLEQTKTAEVTYTATPQSGVTTNPGVGASVAHTNSVNATASDRSGANGNANGPYTSNTATAVARINSADVQLVKSAGAFTAGQRGTFSIRVSNNGPDTASGPFTVTDPIISSPAGLTYVSTTGSGWTCTRVSGPDRIRCVRTNSADTLAPGAAFPAITVTYSVASGVPANTQYDNTASVTSGTYDPNPDNNTDTATANVGTNADLEIVKKLSGNLVAGRDATWTVAVTNNGPSTSRAPITVVDTLPVGTTYRSATGSDWSCSAVARVVTCVYSEDLLIGEVAPAITVTAGIGSGLTGSITNTATVTGTTPDPDPDNNTSTVTDPLETEADLAIAKRHVGDTWVAGQDREYEFQVVNFGPSSAASPVKFVDTLPTGVTYLSATSTAGGWTCSAVGQLLTCTRSGAMAAGLDETITVSVRLAAGLPAGAIENTATVSSPTPDPNPGNNTDTDITDTTTSADLQITKATVASPVKAGETAAFTLTVKNNGPSDSAGPITVTDVVPDGLTYGAGSSATGTGWLCAFASGTVTCTRATTLVAGATADPITLTFDVNSDAGPATIVNTASVDGVTPDPDLSNNTDESPVTVIEDVDLSIVKTRIGSGSVSAGSNVSFELAVSNAGPSDAADVSVTDTLPTGMESVSVSGSGWDCATTTSTYICTRPTLAAGSSAPVISVTAKVLASVADGSTLVNTATVSTSSPDRDPSNDTDTADVPVATVADLELTKSVADSSLNAGDIATYTIAVRNLGPSDAAASVTVVDTFPAGFTYVTTSGAGWSCTSAAGGSGSGDIVTCVLKESGSPVSLKAGTSAASITLIAKIGSDVRAGSYTNSATVTTPTTETTSSNNTDTADVTVGEVADVAIVKSHSGTAAINEDLTWTLAVTNNGPSTARDVVVTDVLPTGLTYVSATGNGWSCAEVTGTVTCTLAAPLAPGASADPISLVTTVGPEAYSSIANTAKVDSSTPDNKPDNNTSTDRVDVPPLVDLEITKSHTGELVVGKQATYTIGVTNNGPTDDPGPVTVVDTLPTGLSYVSATGTDWTCSVNGQAITCTLAGTLAVAAQTSITLVVNVLPEAYPSVTNVATVSSPSKDSNPDNNVATDPGPVTPDVRLTVQKRLESLVDKTATFVITGTNEGTNATTESFDLVDDLPVGLEFVSASGDGFVCEEVDTVVTCTHADPLAPGASASVTVVTTVTAAPGTRVQNVGLITGGGGEGGGGGGTVTPPVDVITPGEGGGLPPTGADVGGLLALSMISLLGGFALLFVRPRRRTKSS